MELRRSSRPLRALLVTAIGAALVALISASLHPATATASGTWSPAEPVPGLAALNTSNDSTIGGISCPSDGNCVAVGRYKAGTTTTPFISVQTNGVWASPIAVVGLATLNTANDASLDAVSCPSVGNCVIGGMYKAGSAWNGFVAVQTNGTWGSAIAVPGLATIRTSSYARVFSASCPAVGECTISGIYRSTAGWSGWAATQSGGTWGNAAQIPGLATLNTGNDGTAPSLSCPSVGNCTVGGYYKDGTGYHGYIATQSNGIWSNAAPVTGLATLDTSNGSGTMAMSCPSVANCTIGGYYRDGTGYHAFLATQTGGSWGNPTAVNGLAALDVGNDSGVLTVSCPSVGNCTVGGYFNDGIGYQAFLVEQTSGTWGAPFGVPGLTALNTANDASVNSVSCVSSGNCSAGGKYKNGAGWQAFLTGTTSSNNTTTSTPATTTTTAPIPTTMIPSTSSSAMGATSDDPIAPAFTG